MDALKQMGLSDREAAVACEVSKGQSNKEVASNLFVSEKTIKFHLTSVYKKMNLKSRSQLIVWSTAHLNFDDKVKVAETIAPAPAPISSPDFPVGLSPVGKP